MSTTTTDTQTPDDLITLNELVNAALPGRSAIKSAALKLFVAAGTFERDPKSAAALSDRHAYAQALRAGLTHVLRALASHLERQRVLGESQPGEWTSVAPLGDGFLVVYYSTRHGAKVNFTTEPSGGLA